MLLKAYFAIKVNDINNKKLTDFNKWEVIYIKAHNYHEAKDDLKKMYPFEDLYIIPKQTLQYREIIKASKHYREII